MKLATWNCCGQFATNLDHLLALDVDVAVVCEARVPVPVVVDLPEGPLPRSSGTAGQRAETVGGGR